MGVIWFRLNKEGNRLTNKFSSFHRIDSYPMPERYVFSTLDMWKKLKRVQQTIVESNTESWKIFCAIKLNFTTTSLDVGRTKHTREVFDFTENLSRFFYSFNSIRSRGCLTKTYEHISFNSIYSNRILKSVIFYF